MLFPKKRRFFSSKKRSSYRKIRRRKAKIDVGTENLLVPKFKTKLGLYTYRFSLIVIIIALGYLIFFSQVFLVQEIIPSGQTENETDLILAEVEPLLEGKILNLIPRRHLFFIPKRKIKKTLLEKFKNFEDISIERKLFGKITIEIQQKDIQLLLCGENECTPLDKNGVATKKIQKGDLSSYYGPAIQIIHDESNSSLEPGAGISTEEHVQFVLGLKEEARNLTGISITELFTPLPSASEIKAKTTDGWLLHFNTEESLEKQTEALKVVLEHEIPAENKLCLEYVDLRIPNKAYYKFYDDCEELKKQKKEEEKRQKEAREQEEKAKKAEAKKEEENKETENQETEAENQEPANQPAETEENSDSNQEEASEEQTDSTNPQTIDSQSSW